MKPKFLVVVSIACLIAMGMAIPILERGKLPPAPREFAELAHFTTEWPTECEQYIDLDNRIYNQEDGVMIYHWVGTAKQQERCWNGIGPSGSVMFVLDSCVYCVDAPPPECQSWLVPLDRFELSPEQMLKEFYLGDALADQEFEVRLWTGGLADLNACSRFQPLRDYVSNALLSSGDARWYYAIEFRDAAGAGS